jgi:DNA-binding CsgD family transcriptional regulator
MPGRKIGQPNRGNSRGVKEALTPEQLRQLYVLERMSLADIAQQFGCTRQYVLTLCRAYGIPRRTKSQARQEALQKGKHPGRSPSW